VCLDGVEIYHEEVYMVQPGGFARKGKKLLVYRLNKSIYKLSQDYKQWYLKFDQVVIIFLFQGKYIRSVHLKASGSQFIIVVLYVNDIVLISRSVEFMTETKFVLNSHFDMMDLGDAFVFLGIQFFVTGHVALLNGLREDILILKV